MDKRELLPGVDPDGYGPQVVCDTRAVILRARRVAALRDVAQLLLVIAVDLFFIRWPHAQIPRIGRDASVAIVALFNALAVLHVIATRKWPSWSARRIAASWCPAERKRFNATASQARRWRDVARS